MKKLLILFLLYTPQAVYSMHINVPQAQYGIGGLFHFSPHTAQPLIMLAEVLLYQESPLLRAEREIIASYVSYLNECQFCCNSHSAIAQSLLNHDSNLLDAIKHNPETAPIPEKFKALLALARTVQQSGSAVTPEIVTRARNAGVTDQEIHDTVLIAAAFCMFNRYVDGLGAWTPNDLNLYAEIGEYIAEHGYVKQAQRFLDIKLVQ